MNKSDYYIFYVYPANYDSKIHKPDIFVIKGQQEMLDQVIHLTKSNMKFSIFTVGQCLADYSL